MLFLPWTSDSLSLTPHTNGTLTTLARSACFSFSSSLNPFQNKQGPPLHPHVPRSGGGAAGSGKAPTSRQGGAGKGKGKKGKKGKKDQYDLIVNIDLVSTHLARHEFFEVELNRAAGQDAAQEANMDRPWPNSVVRCTYVQQSPKECFPGFENALDKLRQK